MVKKKTQKKRFKWREDEKNGTISGSGQNMGTEPTKAKLQYPGAKGGRGGSVGQLTQL